MIKSDRYSYVGYRVHTWINQKTLTLIPIVG